MPYTITDREVIIIIAVVSALFFAYRKQWENVITRLVLAVVYYLSVTNSIESAAASMFLIRWSILLLLFIEVVFSVYVIADKIKKTRKL